MATGVRDTSSLVMLTGWDAAELQKFTLQDGTSYAEIVSQLNGAIGAVNASLANDPLWAGLASFTDQPEVEYRMGVSNGMELHTEYGRANAQRATTEGHMLPLQAFDRMLGWTWDYLRKARMSQIQADIADAAKDVADKWRVKILGRLLQRGDDSGANKGLGSSGYSAGFATAAASTNVDFTPQAYGGTTFDSNHEHYVGIGGGAWTKAAFQDMYDELREHGHEAPFEFLCSPSDRAVVEGLSGFVPVAQSIVNPGTGTAISAVDATQYFGTMLGYIQLREVRGMPQYYGVAYKSYGPRSQRNPLRIRLQKGISVPTVIAVPDPNGGSALTPLQNLMLFLEFGVGVGDRTAATPRYNNNATWADGTAT